MLLLRDREIASRYAGLEILQQGGRFPIGIVISASHVTRGCAFNCIHVIIDATQFPSIDIGTLNVPQRASTWPTTA
jgi:hypothetical protein